MIATVLPAGVRKRVHLFSRQVKDNRAPAEPDGRNPCVWLVHVDGISQPAAVERVEFLGHAQSVYRPANPIVGDYCGEDLGKVEAWVETTELVVCGSEPEVIGRVVELRKEADRQAAALSRRTDLFRRLVDVVRQATKKHDEQLGSSRGLTAGVTIPHDVAAWCRSIAGDDASNAALLDERAEIMVHELAAMYNRAVVGGEDLGAVHWNGAFDLNDQTGRRDAFGGVSLSREFVLACVALAAELPPPAMSFVALTPPAILPDPEAVSIG
jgi:hypothetical protein